MRRCKVALLGDWPHRDNWREVLIELVKVEIEKYCCFLDVDFLCPVAPSRVDFFPHKAGPIVVSDLCMAQEVALAGQADISVYVDDGIHSQARERLLTRVDQRSSAMILWVPPEINKEDEELSEEVGMKPGVVFTSGSIDALAGMVLFLCLQGEDNLS